MKHAIQQLIEGRHLAEAEAAGVMQQIMEGLAAGTTARTAQFLFADKTQAILRGALPISIK